MNQKRSASTATPPEVLPIDYAARWAAIVDRRRVQMETAYANAGLSNVDYWSKRAGAYRASLHQRADEDPFLLRARRAVDKTSNVLDVGAGTGRHTLALAPHVARITAVDPSAAMLGLLREDLTAAGIQNVETLQAEWMHADVERADVVICSHVLYPIADVVPFLRKLDASASQRVLVYIRADPLPTDFGLWSEFHGEPLQAQPMHNELFNVLVQMDIFADVEIVEHRFSWTFESVDEAVDQLANSLCLNESDSDALARLRKLLEERLIPWPNGRLGPDVASSRSAIFSWTPQASRT